MLPGDASFLQTWTSKRRGVHQTFCPPQLSGARQARDVGGNPCITALAKERERERERTSEGCGAPRRGSSMLHPDPKQAERERERQTETKTERQRDTQCRKQTACGAGN